VEKVALGQVFSKYFGFPCQFSFHRLPLIIIIIIIIIIIRGWYNRPNSGRLTEWTQSHRSPRNKKKYEVLGRTNSLLSFGKTQIA
jgi:hypothetical protein